LFSFRFRELPYYKESSLLQLQRFIPHTNTTPQSPINNYQPINNPLSAMSFHLSSENIRVENNHLLVGRLRTQNGELRDTEIDLNQFLGNNDGLFHSILDISVATLLTVTPQVTSSGTVKVG
jgi:hypothetical protein